MRLKLYFKAINFDVEKFMLTQGSSYKGLFLIIPNFIQGVRYLNLILCILLHGE